MGQYIKELPRLSLRRGKNLGDLIVILRQEEGGTGPCGKDCKLCKNMRATEEVTDKDGKEMKLEKKIDCRTIGLIYGMHCKACKKILYVGKTKNRLMERFNGHRADLRGEDESKPAYHFKRDGHKEDDMEVVEGKTMCSGLRGKDGG